MSAEQWFFAIVIVGFGGLLVWRTNRRDRAYLASLHDAAYAQFKSVAIHSENPRYAFSGATAQVISEYETVSRSDGAVTFYSCTRHARNQFGEYFLFKSGEPAPYVKHMSHEMARVVLKTKYLQPDSSV
jgi:hypothetical protein